jgi:putative transposase
MFKSNDIWVGDGHTFKARVQSPIHGNAFRPEVTFIIDWVSRKITGWSVALSENVVAVCDAFRHAQITTRARPLIYYSDNGSGQTAKHIDHPMTGTLGRQGIAHETGIPGSPQGRGILEGMWDITLIALAASYPTFVGKQADRDTVRRVGVELEKAKRKGEASRLLPTFGQFLADLQKCVNDYNQRHSHSELGGMTPDVAYAKHLDPDSTAMGVSDEELRALWMPEEVRTVRRGLIQLFGNEYACPDMVRKLPENAKVRVRFDVHNADTVRILELASGKFLGLGVWDGHRRAAFPVPYVENLRDQRQAGIHRRAQNEMDRADDERKITLDSTGGQVLPFGNVPAYREESLIAVNPDAPLTPKAAELRDFASVFMSRSAEEEAAEKALQAQEALDAADLLARMDAEMRRMQQEEEEQRQAAM